jgi:hypothetical protein
MRQCEGLCTVFRLEVIGERYAFALGLRFTQGFEFAAAFCNQLVLVNDGGGLIFCWRV